MRLRSLVYLFGLFGLLAACSSETSNMVGIAGGGGHGGSGGAGGGLSTGGAGGDLISGSGGTGGGTVGQRCDADSPCPSGFVCEEGVCHTDCGGSARCTGEVCCGAGEVCYLGACTAPGQSCHNPDALSCAVARCPAGQQCDPTLEKCLPLPTNVSCQYTPERSFEPGLLWHWGGSSASPAFAHAITTPSVIDLNGDGAADIIVPVIDYFPGGYSETGGILCALSGLGDCGGGPKELWCTSPDDTRINAFAHPAVADLEGNGDLTIIVSAALKTTGDPAYGIYGYDKSGNKIPDFGTDTDGNPVLVFVGTGGPSVADLDGDGKAEVIVGYTVFNSKGRLVWTKPGATGNNNRGPLTVVADLDGDGRPEIIGGNVAYHGDGTEAWGPTAAARGFGDGWPAVADFNGDGVPEVVVVSSGTVRVFDAKGERFSVADAAIAGTGGPPTIADADGDGAADIVVAGSNSITVFRVGADADHTLTKLWSMPSRDFSSNFTGSSVFDFDGDGKTEVIYADECYARVYDGPGDGAGASTVRFEVPNTSCTATEYPAVVDVTGDGKAEFIVVANDMSGTASACAQYVTACATAYPGYESTHGVSVYRDKKDNWISTRAIYNQHSYHVTNVCDGADVSCPPGENGLGRVPTTEQPSWAFPAASPLNSYRVNARLDGALNAPDLVPTEARADFSACPEAMRLVVAVTNLGAVGVPAGTSVAFYRVIDAQRTLLHVAQTKSVLLPGASETVSFDWAVPAGAGGAELKIEFAVDDDGTGAGAVNECIESNNVALITPRCSLIK